MTKSWKKPTPEQIDKAVSKLIGVQYQRYFFERLENPEWLEPLKEKGFFDNVPERVIDEKEGNVKYPIWPIVCYLARIGSLKPDLVTQIINHIPDTDNILVLDELAEIVLTLPASNMVQLVEKLRSWSGKSGIIFLHEKLGRIAANLAQGGYSDEGLSLMRDLLVLVPRESRTVKLPPELDSEEVPNDEDDEEVRSLLTEAISSPWPRPQTKIDDWTFYQILEKDIPIIAAVAGSDTLRFLCDLLEESITLSERRHGQREDYSYIWRKTIEDNSENILLDIRNRLVSATRDLAIDLVRSGRSDLGEILRMLESRKFLVFDRIALHLLIVFESSSLQEASQRLLTKTLFEDETIQHEYSELLRRMWIKLELAQQNTILTWMDAGPDFDAITENYKKIWKQDPKPEELQKHKEIVRLKHLEWLTPHLTGERAAELLQLKAKYSPSVESSVLTEQEVVDLTKQFDSDTTTMIANYLHEHTPAEEGLVWESQQVVNAFWQAVKKRPDEFAENALAFLPLYPEYMRALMGGFFDALRVSKPFDWKPVLELCEWIIEQPIEDKLPPSHFKPAKDHAFNRGLVLDLLGEGLTKNDQSKIPLELMESVWKCINAFTEDPDPTPARDEAAHDFISGSLNTIRGKAIHAVIKYALWLRQSVEKGNIALDTGEQMRKAFSVLDRHLDEQKDTSLIIRSIYGRWYPWLVLLNEDWAKNASDKIFPVDGASIEIFHATWLAYIFCCPPYDQVYQLLKTQYLFALRNVINIPGEYEHQKDVGSNFTEHLVTFFGRGLITETDVVWKEFWENASPGLRKHAIRFIGESVYALKGSPPSDLVPRLLGLWSQRIGIAKQTPSERAIELAGFGWWFVSDKFDPAWCLEQLCDVISLSGELEPQHMLFEKLLELANDFPAEVAKVIHTIAKSDRGRWWLHYQPDTVIEILSTALHSADTRGKISAEETIDYMGKLGFADVGKLLKT